MANLKSSKKRLVQSEKRRLYNSSRRSMLRTFIKKVYNAINSGDINLANKFFYILQPIIDRQVTQGLIHKNTAARHKSNLCARIKSMKTKKVNLTS